MTTTEKARQINQKLHDMGFVAVGKDNKVTASLNRKVSRLEVERALGFETSNLVLAQRGKKVMVVVVT